MKEAVVIALVVVEIAFSLSRTLGMLRMPDVYTRIQCSSNVTMGALPMLVALVVAKGPLTNYGGRALLVALLLLVVNPVASHTLVRAAYKTGVPMWEGSVIDQPHDRQQRPGPAD